MLSTMLFLVGFGLPFNISAERVALPTGIFEHVAYVKNHDSDILIFDDLNDVKLYIELPYNIYNLFSTDNSLFYKKDNLSISYNFYKSDDILSDCEEIYNKGIGSKYKSVEKNKCTSPSSLSYKDSDIYYYGLSYNNGGTSEDVWYLYKEVSDGVYCNIRVSIIYRDKSIKFNDVIKYIDYIE